MAGSMMEERHFLAPLRGIFDEDVRGWFVGFDKMMEDMAKRWDHAFEYFNQMPTSRIEKTDERHYKVLLKVPGYAKDEITVQREQDELVVRGHHTMKGDKEKAADDRSFEQRFYLAPGIHVDGAKLVKDDLTVLVSFPKDERRAIESIDLK